MRVHVRLLGRFEVEVDGHPVPADRCAARAARGRPTSGRRTALRAHHDHRVELPPQL